MESTTPRRQSRRGGPIEEPGPRPIDRRNSRGGIFLEPGRFVENLADDIGLLLASDKKYDLPCGVQNGKRHRDSLDGWRQHSRWAGRDPAIVHVECGFARKERRRVAVVSQPQQNQIELWQRQGVGRLTKNAPQFTAAGGRRGRR